MYLESSVLLTCFLWQKSLACFLKLTLNIVSLNLLSDMLGSDNTALYTMLAVKYLTSSWYLALLLQLHPRLLDVG